MAFRYERRSPAAACTGCCRPLWPEQVALVARYEPRPLVRLCGRCHRVPRSEAGAAPVAGDAGAGVSGEGG